MDLATYRTTRAKITQQELACILGLKNKSSVCEIENGVQAAPRIALRIEQWSGGAVKATSLCPLLKELAQRQAAA